MTIHDLVNRKVTLLFIVQYIHIGLQTRSALKPGRPSSWPNDGPATTVYLMLNQNSQSEYWETLTQHNPMICRDVTLSRRCGIHQVGLHSGAEPSGELPAISIFPGPVSRECYRRSLPLSSTISVYVGISGVCLRFKPHWMFLIYLRVTKN